MCAFALDGVKNVTNGRTDGQGVSRRRIDSGPFFELFTSLHRSSSNDTFEQNISVCKALFNRGCKKPCSGLNCFAIILTEILIYNRFSGNPVEQRMMVNYYQVKIII